MLSEEQYRFLTDEARRTGKSMSALMRAWLDERIERHSNGPAEADSIWEVVGIGHGGKGRTSERVDRALAAARRKRVPKLRRPGS